MYPGNSYTLTFSNGSVVAIDRADTIVFGYETSDFDRSKQWASLEDIGFKNWMESNA